MKRIAGLQPGDLRGGAALLVQAVREVTDLVESVHGGIQRVATLRLPGEPSRVGGIAGLAYHGVRGVNALVGRALDQLARRLDWPQDAAADSPRRQALLAALNGVLGDQLQRDRNPLAIAMRILPPTTAAPYPEVSLQARSELRGRHVCLLLHGLCMHPGQWRDPAAASEPAPIEQRLGQLGYRPLHLHYNSGLHIADNGAQLAALLEDWVDREAPASLTLLGHSMGGLLARSATAHAEATGQRWLQRLRAIVCLGSPHHGAPLERAGNGLDRLLGALPLVKPFARLGKLRSAGITDLRHGYLHAADWQGHDRFAVGGPARHLPPPPDVSLYLLAATRSKQLSAQPWRQRGDGLVPVASALGVHRTKPSLAVPEQHRHCVAAAHHLQLMYHPEVLQRVADWLGPIAEAPRE